MELDPDDERRLAELEARTSAEDPWFALGLRAGEPCPPAEYRRHRKHRLRLLLALATSALAITAFLAGSPCGGMIAALGAVLALVTIRDGFFSPPSA
ncbi:hypothetical protein GCM10009679_01570 [Saccharothrix algeriensis]